MGEKYEFRTIKDILEKVPPDRISDCMKEISVLLVQMKGLTSALGAIIADIGIDGNPQWDIPEVFYWDDDEAGRVRSNIRIGKDVLRAEYTVKQANDNDK